MALFSSVRLYRKNFQPAQSEIKTQVSTDPNTPRTGRVPRSPSGWSHGSEQQLTVLSLFWCFQNNICGLLSGEGGLGFHHPSVIRSQHTGAEPVPS